MTDITVVSSVGFDKDMISCANDIILEGFNTIDNFTDLVSYIKEYFDKEYEQKDKDWMVILFPTDDGAAKIAYKDYALICTYKKYKIAIFLN